MSDFVVGLILIGMHYLIYKITNKLDNKIYVGKHKTENKNDEYFGSGLLLGRAIEKHGKEHFVKELLFECKTEEEMNQKETDIVDEDFIARTDTYNIKLGGTGGFDYIVKNGLNIRSKEMYSEMGKLGMDKVKSLLEDKEYQEEFRQKQSNAQKLYQSVHGNQFGGRKHSDETKKKMRLARIGKVNGKNNPAFGKHWITNGLISKLVPKTDALPRGFERGRV